MTAYIISRVLYAIPIALGVSMVCFTLIYLAPGNPLQTLLPEDASAETMAIVKKAYGLVPCAVITPRVLSTAGLRISQSVSFWCKSTESVSDDN